MAMAVVHIDDATGLFVTYDSARPPLKGHTKSTLIKVELRTVEGPAGLGLVQCRLHVIPKNG